MAISAQCHQCGFKYNAPDALAGKHVRCKRCSTVFIVQAPAGDGERGDHLNLKELAAGSLSGADVAGQTGGAVEPPLQDPDDIDAVLRGRGSDEMSQADVLRSSRPFDYPYSRQVDTYLPPVMVILALYLIVAQTFGQDDQGRIWIPIVRLLMVAGLYVLVVFPLSHAGVKKGIHKQGSHMPWSAVWKSLAIFSVPYAIGYLLWLTGRSIPSLLLGCLVGLVVAMTALWLLYRIRLERGPEPMVYGAAAFIVAVAIASAFVVGVNLTTLAISEGSASAHHFSESPIMPGLAWNSTPPADAEPDPYQRPPMVARTDPAPSPQDPPPSDPLDVANDAPPSDPPVSDSTIRTPTDPADENALANNDPPPSVDVAAVQDPVDIGTQAPVDPPRDPSGSRPGEAASPGESAGGTAAADPIPEPERSSIVADIATAPVEPGFERALYPLLGADAVLLVRQDGEDEILESWVTQPWERIGAITVRREAWDGEQYAVSPDGAYVARIGTWPTLSVQIMSVKGERPQVLELNSRFGKPTMMGFVDPTHVLVSYSQGNVYGLELWDTRAQRSTQIDLPGVETLDRNFALSSDGKTFAVAARGPSGPVVQTYQLQNGRPIRSHPIRLLDVRWGVRPSGIAYSPDRSMIAALFEKQGNALLNVWKLPMGGNLDPFIYPAGAMAGGDETETDNMLAWVGGGGAWLVHGSEIVDAGAGRIIGRTGLSQVRQQRPARDEIIHLVHPNAAGLWQISVMKLDLEKLSEATKPTTGS